ncbi:MAG: hypothetical protein NXI20_03415 [bacterium]|nr:hypothetical protein [bacterium]
MNLQNPLRGISILCGLIILSISSYAQELGSFVDPRDNRSYETVMYSIDNNSGSISDLDEYSTYLTGEAATFEVNFENGIPSTITWMSQNLNFETSESKCKYDSSPDCNPYGRLYTWSEAMEVCPAGWHLPSDNEWFLLASLYGSIAEAGKNLKTKSLNGTNTSLFSVVKPSIFWSSSDLDGESALDWKVNYRWDKLQRWKGGKNLFNSVRCVKDY